MRQFNYLLLVAFVLFGLSSCEKAFFKENDSVDARNNFEYLWTQCDENYAFFTYKNIDWDEVKARYSAQIRSDMSQEELFDVLAAMMNELRDGHVNLKSEFDVSRYTGFFDNYPENYNQRIIEENYIGFQFQITGPISHTRIANNTIAYLRIPTFETPLTDYQLDYVMGLYKANTKGMIIDLRSNGGGLSTNVFQLGSRLTNIPVHTLDQQIKSGPGRDEFSEIEKIEIEPEGVYYDKPVAVLLNRQSYSATSFFAASMKSFPNVTLIGDSTGGGLGAPNGGELPNGWMYRMSITRSFTPDGSLYENGVPVDIYVDLDESITDKDEIIEAAITELN